MKGLEPTLYLIPVPLSEGALKRSLPEYNASVIREIKYFIVENIRSARRFLKSVDKTIDIDQLHFVELNKRTSPNELSSYLKPMKEGHSLGVISEAGCPAVADPGSDVVAIAQAKGLKVCPLVGPSSILLSVMGSGFNGQSFTFNGYLPIKEPQRSKMIKELETKALRGETQIFIETPYRNNKLLEELLQHCRPSTKICIASDVTSEQELIQTRTASQWAKTSVNLHKIPTIFLLGN